jgi:hypothetical protein
MRLALHEPICVFLGLLESLHVDKVTSDTTLQHFTPSITADNKKTLCVEVLHCLKDSLNYCTDRTR